MTANHVKMRVDITPETSCTSHMYLRRGVDQIKESEVGGTYYTWVK
jgi:hypothetical protein